MELSLTTGLRTVIAEHGTDVKKLRQLAVGIQLILQIGSYSSRRILRTKGDAAAAPVGEAVHFLLDYISGITNAALKQLGMLKKRRPYFPEAILFANVAHLFFGIAPVAHSIRKYILRAAGAFY